MQKIRGWIGILIGLIMMPLVSAYGIPFFWSPYDLLNNEWVRFALSFVFFYALIFFSAKQGFRENASVAIVVGFVGALMISYALMVRGYLNFHFDENILDMIIFAAFVLLFGVFVRFLYIHTSKLAGVVAVVLFYVGIYLVNDSGHPSLYNLPYAIRTLLDLASGILGIVVGLIIIIIIISKKGKNKGIQIIPNVSH